MIKKIKIVEILIIIVLVAGFVNATLTPTIIFPVNNTAYVFTSVPTTINVTASVDATSLSEMQNLTYQLNSSSVISLYDKDLVLMFNFDNVTSLGEGNNNVTFDASLKALNGRCQGVVNSKCNWTTSGVYGNAIQFNGANQFLNVTTPAVQVTTSNFTFEEWIYVNNFTSPANMIASGQWIDSNNYWELMTESSPNGLVFNVKKSGTEYAIETSTSYPSGLTLKTWYSLIGVWNANSNVPTLYINGVNISSAVTVAGDAAPSNPDKRVYISSQQGLAARTWSGRIDEFRFWNRSLTATEAAAHYHMNLNKLNTTQFFLNSSETLNSGSDNASIVTFNSSTSFTYTSNWSMSGSTTTTTTTLPFLAQNWKVYMGGNFDEFTGPLYDSSTNQLFYHATNRSDYGAGYSGFSKLWVLNATTGSPIWNLTMPTGNVGEESGAIFNNKFCFGYWTLGAGEVGTGQTGNFSCYWKQNMSRICTTQKNVTSAIIMPNNTIAYVADPYAKGFYAMNTDTCSVSFSNADTPVPSGGGPALDTNCNMICQGGGESILDSHGHSMICMYANNLTEKWGTTIGTTHDSSIMIDNRTCYVYYSTQATPAAQKGLFVFNSTGSQLWNCTATKDTYGGMSRLNDTLIWGPHTNPEYLYALNISSQLADSSTCATRTIWKTLLDVSQDIYSKPVIAYGMIFITSAYPNVLGTGASPSLRIYNFSDGTNIYNATLGSESFSSPIVVNGHVYVAADDWYLYDYNITSQISLHANDKDDWWVKGWDINKQGNLGGSRTTTSNQCNFISTSNWIYNAGDTCIITSNYTTSYSVFVESGSNLIFNGATLSLNKGQSLATSISPISSVQFTNGGQVSWQ